MQEKIKKIILEILNWIIGLTAIFFMFAAAPFGFLFRAAYDVSLLRVITIFLSTILILYLLRRHDKKN